MAGQQLSFGTPGMLLRQRLIDLLDQRWTAGLTLIEAPGGYGKSTAVAQAVTSNADDPVGIDVVVECRGFHSDASELVSAVLHAFGDGRSVPQLSVSTMVDRLVASVSFRSPTVFCLILDDVHHLRRASTSAELLAGLVRARPANLRVVLSGRSIPPLPLARLEAAGSILRVGREDLAFTEDESQAVAEALGRPRPHAAASVAGGWPAITRLSITTGAVGPADFLLEEVVEQLDPAHRSALAAVVIGRGTRFDDLAHVVDPDILASLPIEVPLVTGGAGEKTVDAHDLWHDLLDRLVDAETRRRLGASLARRLLDRLAFHEAADIAAATGAWGEAREAVFGMAMGGENFPNAERLRLLRERFAGRDGESEVVLLDALIARVGHDPLRAADLAESALAQVRRDGRLEEIAAAAFEVGYGAWLRGDLGRVFEMYQLSHELIGLGDERLVPLVRVVEAILADLQGDAHRTVELLTSVDLHALPGPLVVHVVRELISKLTLIGESARAIPYFSRLDPNDPRQHFSAALALWMGGQPDAIVGIWEGYRHQPVGDSQTDFLMWVYSTQIDASLGIGDHGIAEPSLVTSRTREQAYLAVARAARAVARGDEDGACLELARLDQEAGFDDPLCRGELRRMPAVPWVLSERSREVIGGALGPDGERRVSVGQLLLQLRTGGATVDSAIPSAEHLVTSVPLRWSVEILARSLDDGSDSSRHDAVFREAQRLNALTAGRFRTFIRELPPDTPGLSALDAHFAPGAETARLTLFGAMGFVPPGATSRSPVTRPRVRQLIGILALRRRVSVAELVDMLWPEMSPESASDNLAATVRLARAVLDVDPGGLTRRPPASSRLVRDATSLRLRRTVLTADLWDVVDLLDRLDRSTLTFFDLTSQTEPTSRSAEQSASSPHSREAMLEEVVRLAGSDVLLPDLDPIVDLAGDLESVRRRIADAVCELAEFHLSAGRSSDAGRLAGQLLAVTPFDTRAHTTRIHAAADSRDRMAVRRAVIEAEAAVAEIGGPVPSTLAMAIRRGHALLAA